MDTLKALTLAFTFLASAALAEARQDQWFRRAAWEMVPVGHAELVEQTVQFGEPFFVRRMATIGSVRISEDVQVLVGGMPHHKNPEKLILHKGQVFHKMAGPPGDREIYCGGGVGYIDGNSFGNGAHRICLSDKDGDGKFDQLYLGFIWTEQNSENLQSQNRFGLVGALLTATDGHRSSFDPVIITNNSEQLVSIPYQATTKKWSQFDIGLVIFDEKGRKRIGLIKTDGIYPELIENFTPKTEKFN